MKVRKSLGCILWGPLMSVLHDRLHIIALTLQPVRYGNRNTNTGSRCGFALPWQSPIEKDHSALLFSAVMTQLSKKGKFIPYFIEVLNA